jgi:hypothetical protein
MPLTGSEFKTLRDDLRTARGLVDNAFSTARAAGAASEYRTRKPRAFLTRVFGGSALGRHSGKRRQGLITQ